MAKILIITDDPNATTGNAKVCRYLCKGFEELGHTITSIVAWNCLGGNNKYHYKLWPVDPDKQTHRDTGVKVQLACDTEQPDIIFVHGDIWNFNFMPKIKTTAKKIGYITVDFEPVHHEWLPIYKSFDSIISPSVYGSDIIARDTNIIAEVIHEGVDTSIFKPLTPDMRSEVRKSINKICEGDKLNIPNFYATMLSRPINRKNLPAGIHALAKLSEKYDDIGLICLYDPMSGRYSDAEHDMNAMHKVFLPGKMPKITLPKVGPLSQECTDEQIALHLGASDVLLMPTMGEGFGLPVLEAMACGCIPIVTNCTSMPDLVDNDRGYLVDVGSWIHGVAGTNKNSRHSMISDKHLYECLKEAYENMLTPKGRTRMRVLQTNAIAFANKLPWKRCATLINNNMMRTMAGNNDSIRMERI